MSVTIHTLLPGFIFSSCDIGSNCYIRLYMLNIFPMPHPKKCVFVCYMVFIYRELYHSLVSNSQKESFLLMVLQKLTPRQSLEDERVVTPEAPSLGERNTWYRHIVSGIQKKVHPAVWAWVMKLFFPAFPVPKPMGPILPPKPVELIDEQTDPDETMDVQQTAKPVFLLSGMAHQV